MAGYIKLHRKWHDSPMFGSGPYCERAAWAWLLTNTAWKDTQRRTPGGLIDLKRGQIHVSLRSLAGTWKWSKGKVERFLDVLETGRAIGQQTGHGGRILTICNFDEYQGNGDESGTSSGTASGTRTGQGRDTQEEGKERKEDIGRAHALPNDWSPKPFGKGTKSAAIIERWSEDRMAEQVERFKAHHRKVGSKFKSWQDAWSTWVLNSNDFAPRQFGNAATFDHDDPDGKYWWLHDRAAGAGR